MNEVLVKMEADIEKGYQETKNSVPIIGRFFYTYEDKVCMCPLTSCAVANGNLETIKNMYAGHGGKGYCFLDEVPKLYGITRDHCESFYRGFDNGKVEEWDKTRQYFEFYEFGVKMRNKYAERITQTD